MTPDELLNMLALSGAALAVLGVGVSLGGLVVYRLIMAGRRTVVVPAPLDVEREVEALPEWREKEYRQAISDMRVTHELERGDMLGNLEQAARDNASLLQTLRQLRAELRAQKILTGRYRTILMRETGATSKEVRAWLSASRKK